jgi:von Willebrand factor type A domain/FHA domain
VKTSSFVWTLRCGLGVLLGLVTLPTLAVPQDIVLVFDNSGSMRRADPGFAARAAARGFLLDLPTDARVAVLIFDEKIVLSMPLALAGDGKALSASLDGVDYRGPYTNSPAAVERALDVLKTNRLANTRQSVVLMTDGVVDTGNRQVDAERRAWLRDNLAQEAATDQVRLFGLAFTKSADMPLMQSLATSTHGGYFRAYTLAELPNAFAKLRAALLEDVPAPPPTEVSALTTAPALPTATAQPALPLSPAPPASVGALSAAPLAPPVALPDPAPGAPPVTPEDRAALEQMSRETGVPMTQLLAELARGQALQPSPVPPSSLANPPVLAEPAQPQTSPPLPVAAPASPVPAPSRAHQLVGTGVGLGIAIGAGIALLGGAAWWLLRRRTRENKLNSVPSAPTIAPSKPSKVPEGWLIDIHGYAGLPPYRLTDKPLMVCRAVGSDSDYLDYYLVEKTTIGRRHAVIKYKDRSFWVVDQGSVNGTFVNDEKVAGERQLRNGDLIKFHKFEFEFQHPGLAGAEPTWVGLPAEQTIVADMDTTQAATPVVNLPPAVISPVVAAAPSRHGQTLAQDRHEVTREGELENLEDDRDDFFNPAAGAGARDFAATLPPLLDGGDSEGVWDELTLALAPDDPLSETLPLPIGHAAFAELDDPLTATFLRPSAAVDTDTDGFFDDLTIRSTPDLDGEPAGFPTQSRPPGDNLTLAQDFYTATTLMPAAQPLAGWLTDTVALEHAATLPATASGADPLAADADLTLEDFLASTLPPSGTRDILSSTQDDFEMLDTVVSSQPVDADGAPEMPEEPFNEATVVLASSPLTQAKGRAPDEPTAGA